MPGRWWVAAGAIVILALGGGVGVIQRARMPAVAVPEIELTNLASQALAIVEKSLDAVRREPGAAAAWGRLGGTLKRYGFPEQAAVCLSEAHRRDGRDARWPYLLGGLQEAASVTASLDSFRLAATLAGHTPEMPALRLARRLAELGLVEEARGVAGSLFRDRPACAPAQLLLAQLDLSAGKWAEAARQAQACRSSPYTARAARMLLAVVERQAGRTDAADQVGREAANAPPDTPWPDPYEAEVQSWCDDPRSLSDAAQRHLLAGRFDDAAPTIELLTRRHPDFAEAWLLQGRLLLLRKQPAPAEAALRRHLALETNSVNGHFQLGMTLLAQQRFLEAAEVFKQTILLKPDLGPAHFNLAFALARSGRLREAVDPFEQAIRHNPEKIDSYLLLADLQVRLGRPEAAAPLADLAARLDSTDPRLGHLREKIGLR